LRIKGKDMVFVKSHDIAELTSELIGKEVVLGGWVEDFRKLGKMSFITLRDVTGISQVIVKGELNDNLGEINRQSVVSVKGIVFDVSKKDCYREGGNYHIFAGKDASIALAKMKFDKEFLDDSIPISDLNEAEMGILDHWENYMKERYEVVGKLKDFNSNSGKKNK